MIFNIKMYEPKKSYAVVKSTGYESVLRHSHEFVEMVFVESGSAVQKVNSETVELRRGDMFVIADDSEHSMRLRRKRFQSGKHYLVQGFHRVRLFGVFAVETRGYFLPAGNGFARV